MRVTYDPEVDILTIRLSDAPAADTTTLDEPGVAENLAIDLDAEGRVIGFEITGASRLPGIDLDAIHFAIRRHLQAAE